MPRQERSRQRLSAILDAAEQVIAEIGYEAATTEAIARRAGTSIGSLYRYFPHKEALVEVLVDRHLDLLRAFHAQALSAEHARLPLEELLDEVIDGLVELKSAHPALWSLLQPGSPLLAERTHQLHGELADIIQTLLAARAPDMPARNRALRAEVTLRAVEAILPLALESGGDRRRQVVTELKRLLLGYLGPAAGL